MYLFVNNKFCDLNLIALDLILIINNINIYHMLHTGTFTKRYKVYKLMLNYLFG